MKRINTWKMFDGTFIPNWLLLREDVSAMAKIVYARLSRFAGARGYAFPKQPLLAKSCGCKLRSLQGYLDELKELRLIESVQQGFGKPNLYYFLDHSWIQEALELQQHRGDDSEEEDNSQQCQIHIPHPTPVTQNLAEPVTQNLAEPVTQNLARLKAQDSAELDLQDPAEPLDVLKGSLSKESLSNEALKNNTNISPLRKKLSQASPKIPPPEILQPSDNLRAWHAEKFPQYDLDDAIESCLDHYRKEGKRAADYEAAVRNWLKNGHSYGTLKPVITNGNGNGNGIYPPGPKNGDIMPDGTRYYDAT